MSYAGLYTVNVRLPRAVTYAYNGGFETGDGGPDAVVALGSTRGYVPTPFTRSREKYLYETKVDEQMFVPPGVLITTARADINGTGGSGAVLATTAVATPPSAPENVSVAHVSGTLYRVSWSPLPPLSLVSYGGVSVDNAQYVTKLVVGRSVGFSNVVVATDMSSADVSGTSAVVDMAGFDFQTDPSGFNVTTATNLHVSLYNTGFGVPNWSPWPTAPFAPADVDISFQPGRTAIITWSSPPLAEGARLAVGYNETKLDTSRTSATSAVVNLSGVDFEGGTDVILSVSHNNGSSNPAGVTVFTAGQTVGLGLSVTSSAQLVAGAGVKLACTNLSRTIAISDIIDTNKDGEWAEPGSSVQLPLGGSTTLTFAPRRAGKLRFASLTDRFVFPAEYDVLPAPVVITTDYATLMMGERVGVLVSFPDTQPSAITCVMTPTITIAGTWDISSFVLPTTRPFQQRLQFTPTATGAASFGISSAELDISVTPAALLVVDPEMVVWSETPVVTYGTPIVVNAVYMNGVGVGSANGVGGTVAFAADVPGWWSLQTGDFRSRRSIVTSEFHPDGPGTINFSAVGRSNLQKYVAASSGATWSSTVIVAGSSPTFRAAL